MYTLLIVVTTIVITTAVNYGLYHLFKDTLNRVQYLHLGSLYLFWMTRDDGGHGKTLYKSFMRMTAFPWLQGTGITFRIPTGKTFQLGLAKAVEVANADEGLSAALGAHPMNLRIDEIRDLDASHLVKVED